MNGIATRTLIGSLASVGLLIAASSVAQAELYRWIDERGVINYSNEQPKAAKDVRVVENRLSSYTPDAATMDMVRRTRERRLANAGTSPAPVQLQRRLPDYPTVIQSGPMSAADNCLPGDIDCYGAPVYYTSPVFSGRDRVPLTRAAQLPVGAIAGNVVGTSGYIAGLSGQAGVTTSTPGLARQRAGFTVRQPSHRGGGGHGHR